MKNKTIDGKYGTFKIEWETDYYADTSWIGEFTDEGRIPDTWPREQVGRHEYKRFRPANSWEDKRNFYLREKGYTWSAACRQATREVQEDMAHLEEYAKGNVCQVSCIVTYFVEGFEIWVETHVGVEADGSDSPYFEEVERDLIEQMNERDLINLYIDNLRNQIIRLEGKLAKHD